MITPPIRRVDTPPAGRVAIGKLTFAILELDVLRFGKVRAQVVRGAGLQRLAILHHRFDRIGIVCAGEALIGGLLAGDDGHREHRLGKLAIDLQHLLGLDHGVVAIDVRRMPFLPEEFRSPQEQPRAHLPAHDVGPLIDEQRQVAIALDPALERIANDSFRRRTNDERLFQLGSRVDHQLATHVLQPVMRDDRHLLGEASTCSASLAMKLIGMKSGK